MNVLSPSSDGFYKIYLEASFLGRKQKRPIPIIMARITGNNLHPQKISCTYFVQKSDLVPKLK